MSNTITISACDNELIVLAFQTTGSYQLLDLQSGNSNAVKVTLTIQEGTYSGSLSYNGVNQGLSENLTQNLPSGTYELLLLGINWGGPTQFTVEVNGTSQTLPYTGSGTTGLVFNPGPISITV